MSLSIPTFPQAFEWWEVRQELEEWFFRFAKGQMIVVPGLIMLYGSTTAPEGWVLCDGASYEQELYAELYNVIGTTFGGSGSNFQVPNISATVSNTAWVIKV